MVKAGSAKGFLVLPGFSFDVTSPYLGSPTHACRGGPEKAADVQTWKASVTK